MFSGYYYDQKLIQLQQIQASQSISPLDQSNRSINPLTVRDIKEQNSARKSRNALTKLNQINPLESQRVNEEIREGFDDESMKSAVPLKAAKHTGVGSFASTGASSRKSGSFVS